MESGNTTSVRWTPEHRAQGFVRGVILAFIRALIWNPLDSAPRKHMAARPAPDENSRLPSEGACYGLLGPRRRPALRADISAQPAPRFERGVEDPLADLHLRRQRGARRVFHCGTDRFADWSVGDTLDGAFRPQPARRSKARISRRHLTHYFILSQNHLTLTLSLS